MEKLKVVGILGSPRRNGNTEILLDEVLKAAGNSGCLTRKFVLNEMDFVPCQECENIRKDGFCKIQDEMQKIYPEIENADVVAVASPVFFGSLSAQTKMMIDRFQCQWLGIKLFKSYKIKKKKTGVFICTEATEREDFLENARSIVKNFFAVVGAKYEHEIFCRAVDRKGAVREKKECLELAQKTGLSLIKMYKEKAE
jgi:multimeric flavodoxin WrbA